MPHKPKESKELRTARREKREAKKEYNQALKIKINVEGKYEKYKQSQLNVRNTIQTERKEKLKEIYGRIVKEGGTKSQYFWKIRRQILGTNKPLEYDTITEEGEKITDAQQSKTYIAEYYQNLYQAREADEDEKQNTEEIERIVKELSNKPSYNAIQENITRTEINKAIKCMKKGKSMGPDELPNEAIMEMNERNRHTLKETMNEILQQQNIPETWETGTITRLYKGKGKQGKCSNERGITVSSNMGKMFERIVNNRAKQQVKISDAQAGGKEKRATTDHLFILKDVINAQKQKKKPIYMAFLDVTKAYDKAWLTGIMYALHKNGLTGPLWNIVRKLNTNLKANIKTKDGMTDPITIKDSIRQGGVLSVMMYALVMDEIAKKLNEEEQGCKIPGSDKKVGCLLWMDDVVLMNETPQGLQEMLTTTNIVAKKYHIHFGKEKSKIMTTDKNKTHTFYLGNMQLEYTETYKYLGESLHYKQKLSDHIKQMRGKTEGALQTILTIAKDPNLKGIEMETVWKLFETCITPIMTYGCETWNPTISETKEINKIIEGLIKRILLLPITTPREALYTETGLKDIKFFIDKNRLNMEKRMEKTKNEMISEILINTAKNSWKNQTTKTHEQNQTKIEMNKKDTLNKLEHEFKKRIDKESEQKSKIKFLRNGNGDWTPGKRQTYLSKLTRNEASTIFQLRTRMIKVKRNYKNAYTNLTCRGCKANEETQEHVLENCTKIHETETTKIHKEEYFTENVNMLKQSVKKLDYILARLDQSDVSAQQKTARYPGVHSTS